MMHTDTFSPSPAFYDYINQEISTAGDQRLLKREWNKTIVWIKRETPSKKNLWHTLQTGIAFLLQHPILKPTVTPGGTEALQQEAAVLKKLHPHLPVPQVLALTDAWLALSHTGEHTVEAYCRTHPEKSHDALYFSATQLAHLHQAGFYHGAPLTRNITLDETPNGFLIHWIDFEEIALKNTPLTALQARDFLLFLWSALPDLNTTPEKMVAHYFSSAPHAVKHEIRRIYPLGKKLVRLLSRIKPLAGRDLTKARHLTEALSAFFEKTDTTTDHANDEGQ